MKLPDWTTQTDTSSSFHGYGNLPAEIRLSIWELALPGPRLIYLKHLDPRMAEADLDAIEEERHKRNRYMESAHVLVNYTPHPPEWPRDEDFRFPADFFASKNLKFQWKSYCPVPSMLHTCRDSRSVALKYYELSFSTCYTGPQTYFNFEKDILYINYASFEDQWYVFDDSQFNWEEILKGDAVKVKWLALNFGDRWTAESLTCHVRAAMDHMSSLKQVAMVIDDRSSEGRILEELRIRRPPGHKYANLVILDPLAIPSVVRTFESNRPETSRLIHKPGHTFWGTAFKQVFDTISSVGDEDAAEAEDAGREAFTGKTRPDMFYGAVTTATTARKLAAAIADFKDWNEYPEAKSRQNQYSNLIAWWVGEFLPAVPDY